MVISTSTALPSPDVTRGARPPRGWNSFDAFGLHLDEATAVATVDVMAERLAPAGFDLFVIDGGWYNEYLHRPGTRQPVRPDALDINLDAYGRLLPSRSNFPGGLERVVRYARHRGLRSGIHLMRGIPRKAVELDLPILGTGYTARDVVDRDHSCRWCDTTFGVDMSAPGAQPYYDSVIALVADWGFDFVKADDMTGFPEEIHAVADAIERSGRPMTLSLSPGEQTDVDRLPAYRRADLLRLTRDVWDEQADIDAAFDAWRTWAEHPQETFWLDLDMLPFGALLTPFHEGSPGEKDAVLHGRGVARVSRLTVAQQQTAFTMRVMAASPLFLGADLLRTDDTVFDLVTQPELLACHDLGRPATHVVDQDDIEVWRCDDGSGGGWVGAFNRADRPTTLPPDSRWTQGVPVVGPDAWSRERRPVVPPNGVAFWRFGPDESSEATRTQPWSSLDA